MTNLQPAAVKLTVYSRANCHLCDDMLAGLQEIQRTRHFLLEVVDVDRNTDLVAAYGERVPVLVAADGELCHYYLNRAKVDEYLSEIR